MQKLSVAPHDARHRASPRASASHAPYVSPNAWRAKNRPRRIPASFATLARRLARPATASMTTVLMPSCPSSPWPSTTSTRPSSRDDKWRFARRIGVPLTCLPLTSNSRPFARHGAATRAMTRRARVNIYVRRVRIASGRRRRVRARMRPSHDVRLSIGLSTFRAPFVDASTSPSRTRSRADMSAQGGSSQERIASQAVGIGRSTSRPQSKSQFAGYAANADLRVDGSSSASSSGASSAAAAMQAQRRRRPSHPWLDYPPDFERKAGAVLGAAARVLNPANLLAPLPPALKYSLTRNFGFVTKTFTQFFDPEGVKSVQESIGLGK